MISIFFEIEISNSHHSLSNEQTPSYGKKGFVKYRFSSSFQTRFQGGPGGLISPATSSPDCLLSGSTSPWQNW